MTFTVTKAGTGAATVHYAIAAAVGTATSGVDFVALTAGILSFATLDTTKTITVMVKGDTTCEPDETVVVTLSGATNFATIGTSQGVGTITNDDR